MSWLEKSECEFIIQTGDGLRYTVLWENPNLGDEFNVATFNFPGVRGTLVDRGEIQGTRYPIEFYFVGENHLDDMRNFRESSKDKRRWTVTHPLYGSIICHPIKLHYDNAVENVTKVTGEIMETIVEDRPKLTVNPVDKIVATKLELDALASTNFAGNVDLGAPDINTLSVNTAGVYSIGKRKLKLTADAQGYFNAFNKANAAILSATAEPLAAAIAIQTMLNAPALFVDSVQNRIGTLVDQMEYLRVAIPNSLSYARKKIHELFGGAIISTMAQASASPEGNDYENREQVYNVAQIILTTYSQYLADLDGMQSENGGAPGAFIPDADSMIQLNSLINYTITNLFDIALDSKQERTVYLETDSSILECVHRFYGLDPDDENLNRMIRQNGFGLNDFMVIPKGRKIIYYV
jgi:hypothetical protein